MISAVVRVFRGCRNDYVELDCGHIVNLHSQDDSNVSLVGSETECPHYSHSEVNNL